MTKFSKLIKRNLLTFLAVFLFLGNANSQKTEAEVFYNGVIKDLNIKVQLKLINGNLKDSEITMVLIQSNATYKFVSANTLDSNNTLKFYHFSDGGIEFSDHCYLKNMKEAYTIAPTKISAAYSFKDTSYKFNLFKRN